MQFQFAYSGLRWTDVAFVLIGLYRTIILAMISIVLGTLLGVVFGWAREGSRVVSRLSAPYVDITRSIPLLIQFILANSAFSVLGMGLEPLSVGVITLSLYMAVLTSELVRSGLRSVRPELNKAARSLGMNYWQELRLITMPLALRTIFPSWIGTALGVTKDTALVSVVGYIELLRAAQILITRTNDALLILLGVGVAYFLICYPVSYYSRALERRLEAA